MFKKQFLTLLGIIGFSMLGLSGLQAQNQCASFNETACSTCNPSVSSMTVQPFSSNTTKFFAVNSSGNGLCERIDYCWETDAPGSSITNARGQSRIRFTTAGIWTVSLTITWWFDANGNNQVDAGERCSRTSSTVVTVN